MYKVFIEHRATGEVRSYVEGFGWCANEREIWAPDGRLGCDCGRSYQYERIAGCEARDPGACTSHKFALVITSLDGDILYQDDVVKDQQRTKDIVRAGTVHH